MHPSLANSPVRMLKVSEVADLLGVARSFVYRELLDTGQLKSVKLGSKARRIPLAEVQALLVRLAEQQTAE
jgi:excisionase family DNA binding protein